LRSHALRGNEGQNRFYPHFPSPRNTLPLQTAPAKPPFFRYPDWTHLHGPFFKEELSMPSKPDHATALAEKLLHTLEAQRALGADAYPLTLRRLAEQSDPQAPPEL